MANRIAFTLYLQPGKASEYEVRHNEIWPELVRLLHDSGISDYSIFLDDSSNTLFATLCLAADHDLELLPNNPIMQRWWSHMADIMVVDQFGRPVSENLDLVFHLP